MESSRRARRPTLPALTGLRLVAALLVVFGHYGPVSAPDGGGIAVSLFFILSGFILAYSYPPDQSTNWREYFIARIARIYPVYLLGCLVALPSLVSWHAVPPSLCAGEHNVLRDITSTVALVQVWDFTALNCLNPPGWSVSCEATFYVFFPAILWACSYLSATWLPRIVVGLWLIYLGSPLSFLVIRPTGATATLGLHILYYSPLIRLPQFIGGVVLGLAFVRGARLPYPTFWGAVAVVACWSTHIICPVNFEPLVVALATPSLALLVVALANATGPLAWILSRRPMVVGGEASYALYILHAPLWVWLTHIFPSIAAGRMFLGYLPLALLISILVHLWYERPARSAIRQLADGHLRTPLFRT